MLREALFDADGQNKKIKFQDRLEAASSSRTTGESVHTSLPAQKSHLPPAAMLETHQPHSSHPLIPQLLLLLHHRNLTLMGILHLYKA